MARNGWSVLRFWHVDVLLDRSRVLDTIVAALDGRLTKPTIAPDLRFIPALRSHEPAHLKLEGTPHPPCGHLLPVNGEKERS